MSTIKYSHLNSFLIFILLASFIISTSGYALITVPGNSYLYMLLIFPILFFLYLYIRKNEIIYLNFHNLSYPVLILSAIFSCIINLNLSFIPPNIKFITIITFAFLFTKLISFDDFVKYFLKTMKFIVLVSLIGYILINFIKVPINLPTFVNVNGVEYYNGIIFFAIKRFSEYTTPQMSRNTGCFWEPGLFASFITIALIFEVLFKKRKSFYNIILFVLGLLSTRSTFGYLMIPFILVIYITKDMKGIKGSIGLIISLIFFTFVYLNIDNVIDLLYTKWPIIFGKIANMTDSYVRIKTPFTNLKVFLMNPIFGAGLGKADGLFYSINNIPQTSTSTYFLAAFGIFGIFYSLFLIYGILMSKVLSFPNRLIILIIFLIILNKEPHTYNTATYIFIFFFLKISSLRNPVTQY